MLSETLETLRDKHFLAQFPPNGSNIYLQLKPVIRQFLVKEREGKWKT